MTDPTPAAPVTPPSPPTTRPPQPRDRRLGCLLPIVLILLFLSLGANVLLSYLVVSDLSAALDTDRAHLKEKFYLGEHGATDKVAVIRIDGVIADSTIAYPLRQMEQAAKDRHVKAVVLRVDSPGGTVTASEELYQCLVNLRDNTGRRFAGTGPKPIHVSMGGLAASGGYYISTAGKPIAAERTTITGSIGVFVALPNVAELAHKNGVKVELVKAGEIKASGSFFHDLSQEERQTWQDTVDNAYDLFLERIVAGRVPLTKEQMRNDVVIDQRVQERDEKGNPKLDKGQPAATRYVRKRADGGTFTADQALKFQLIDRVQDLPATVRDAAAAAGLTKFRAVVYEKPTTLMDLLLGHPDRAQAGQVDLRQLSSALTPRLWYLSPSADGAILTPTP